MALSSIPRRSILAGAAGASLAAAGGIGLAGCTSNDADDPSNNGAVVPLPSYLPYDGVTPDLPGDADGVLNGFLTFPADPVSATNGTPGEGGTVAALTVSEALPPAVGRNPYWQELNKRLGVELTFNTSTSADYSAKLSTVLAGGDLPDFVQMTTSIPRLPDILRSQFQDLSEFLSGDAAKDYPNLANLPPQSWKSVIYNDGIYGIPKPFGNVGTIMFTRRDILEEKGLAGNIGSAEEFIALCRELTDAAKNRWASGSASGFVGFFREMLGVGNAWLQTNGAFRHVYETDEHKKAMDSVIGMWKEGLFHPDSFASSAQNANQWYGSGTVALTYSAYTNWLNFTNSYGKTNPKFAIGAIPPPSFDGTAKLGVKALGSGVSGFAAIKKSDPSRVRQLLRIANWLSSPFGTQEYRLSKYGLPGVHHELTGTDPVLTQTGTEQIKVPIYYVSNPPSVLYVPGNADIVREQYEYQKLVIPTGEPSAGDGLVSETLITKNAQLERGLQALQNDVLQGRKSLDDWTQAMQQWRKDGGDQIRNEFEDAFASQN